MRRAEAKIVENRKEDPVSGPDQDPNTWLIEAKLDEDILDWETVRLDFRISEIDAPKLSKAVCQDLTGSRFAHAANRPCKTTMSSMLTFGTRPKAEES